MEDTGYMVKEWIRGYSVQGISVNDPKDVCCTE